MEQHDAIIIGGGPAGLFCAISCSVSGRSILLLEKQPVCGKKLLLTGSGQCNITHEGDIPQFVSHYGRNGRFVQPALFQFTNQDLTAYLKEQGIPLVVDMTGKIFPESRRSKDILDSLSRDLGRKGVRVRCNEPVLHVLRERSTFRIATMKNEYRTGAVVIATGGMSYPQTGSSGDGYAFARSLGHAIRTPVPALTPIIIRDYPFTDLAGISFPDCFFTIWREGKKRFGGSGDVLLTHTGLSGPGILDSSRYMMAGDEIRLSFVNAPDRQTFTRDFLERVHQSGRSRVASVLLSYQLPSRFTQRILEISGIHQDLPCSQLTVHGRIRLITALTGLPLKIQALGDFSVAMVTKGGVTLSEVNAKTMESRICPGLFFAGEILDFDGDSGGYNLQAAFSTGYLAAKNIRKRWNDPEYR